MTGGQAVTGAAGPGGTGADERATVLVYSNSASTRALVQQAVGRRPAPDSPRIDWIECATDAEVVAELDEGGIDLAILDGEAQPTGGMGVSRQLKNEIDDCPPIIVTVRRRDDRWLATWSQADAVLVHPLDPLTAAETVADVLRRAQAEDADGIDAGGARALDRG
jgi:DNA-binding response OmpR family regulator